MKLTIGGDGSERACAGQDKRFVVWTTLTTVEDVFDAADFGGGGRSGGARGCSGAHGSVVGEGRRDITVRERRDQEESAFGGEPARRPMCLLR
jgi:hypothetical protein